MNTTKIGTAGEDAAANYLMRKGYRIAERNYKCKVAEIDIIAYNNDDTICFIEVKTRKNFQFGYPSEFVDSRKQHKIHLGAMSYINKKQIDKQTVQKKRGQIDIQKVPIQSQISQCI